jgi:hypothetical protein
MKSTLKHLTRITLVFGIILFIFSVRLPTLLMNFGEATEITTKSKSEFVPLATHLTLSNHLMLSILRMEFYRF